MTVRFGIIGAGVMAAAMVPALRLAGGAELVAVASRSDARARTFAEAHGARDYYGEPGVMFREETIDAIYIANATGAHAETAIAALEAGKHVLCEKPFAMTVAEGERVLETARRTGRLFMEGLWTHFLPAYRRVHDLVKDKALGDVRQLTAAYGYPTSPDLRPRLYDKHDGGVVLDIAVYPVSLALRLMGPVESVSAQLTRNEDGVDTHAAAQLVHRGGGVSQLAASFDALTANAATVSCRNGAVSMPAPLFGAESVIIERHAPQSGQGAGGGGSKLKAALKAVPLLRQAKAALRGGGEHYPYGANQYLPQMKHFLSLIAAGKTESDIASHGLSLETLRVLDRLRA